MNIFVLLWILWALAFVVIEAAAIYMKQPTLSAIVWHLLDNSMVARAALFAVFGWLSWHWFAESRIAPNLRATFRDDGLVVFLFALLGIGTRRK